jgi:hypothetical protein
MLAARDREQQDRPDREPAVADRGDESVRVHLPPQHPGQFRDDQPGAHGGERDRRREEQHQRYDHELQGRRVERADLELDPGRRRERGDHHDQQRHVHIAGRRHPPQDDGDHDERDRSADAKGALARPERLGAACACLLEELLLDQRVVVDHGLRCAHTRAMREFGSPSRSLRVDK